MIDSRQKEVDDLYDNANRAKAEAEEMRARYETRLRRPTPRARRCSATPTAVPSYERRRSSARRG